MNISNVYLVGCGGTGSLVSEPLVRLLSFHANSQDCTITFVDGDEYEAKNHGRQIFTEEAEGRPKARHTRERLRFLNPRLREWRQYVNKEKLIERVEEDGLEEEEGVSLFIATVDNHQSRKEMILALETFYSFDWIFITAGNGLHKGQLSVYGRVGGETIGINPLTVYQDMANPTDKIPVMRKGCMEESVEVTQLISANFGAAYMILSTVQNMLDGEKFYDELFFDFRKGKITPGMPINIDSNPKLEIRTDVHKRSTFKTPITKLDVSEKSYF